MADLFPIHHPPDAPRLFTQDSLVRRFAKVAHWTQSSKVLELSGSVAGLLLAKELGVQLTVADSDPKALEAIKERAKALGLDGKVRFEKIDVAHPPFKEFKEGEFDGILVMGRLVMPLDQAALELRKLLAPRARLVLSWPVRVGRTGLQEAIEFWDKRVGQALMMPRETLMALERQGFEPETLEVPTNEEVDEYYRQLEAALAKHAGDPKSKDAAAELKLFKDNGHRQGVTMAVLVGRRKEPGERPPPSRDSG